MREGASRGRSLRVQALNAALQHIRKCAYLEGLGCSGTWPGKGRPEDVPHCYGGPAIEAGGWRLSIPAASGPWPEPGRNAASPRGLPVSSPAQSRTPGGFGVSAEVGASAHLLQPEHPAGLPQRKCRFQGHDLERDSNPLHTDYQSVALPMSYPKVTESNRQLACKASAHHGRDPVMEHGTGKADRARGVSRAPTK